ncbi:MAG TPA: alcohol dehydrogenase catalytic domain-containing protein, partial [Sphingomonas sp.]|nr:alcohol dehydrogenase catalytic domain-containing protein [Sphingomonas sp.]
MARVARIEQHGGPEVIQWADIDLPDPGPGEVRIRSTAVGLNFIEIYQRTGLYPLKLPSGLGTESVGVIEALGDGVTDFAVGDRVGTTGPTIGSYATHRNLPAESLVKLPDSIDDRTAAAILLKGGTTEFLIERCAKVQPGWTVLVHAAAGGVGHLAVG